MKKGERTGALLNEAEEVLRVFDERRAEANRNFIQAMLARRKMTGSALDAQNQVCKDLERILDAATHNYVNAKGKVDTLKLNLKFEANKAKTFAANGGKIRH